MLGQIRLCGTSLITIVTSISFLSSMYSALIASRRHKVSFLYVSLVNIHLKCVPRCWFRLDFVVHLLWQ